MGGTRTNAKLVKFAVRLLSFEILLIVFKLSHESAVSKNSVAFGHKEFVILSLCDRLNAKANERIRSHLLVWYHVQI